MGFYLYHDTSALESKVHGLMKGCLIESFMSHASEHAERISVRPKWEEFTYAGGLRLIIDGYAGRT